MKKGISILVLCLFVISVAKAGDGLINFGLKGGLNFPSLNAQDGAPTLNTKTGFHAGAMVKVNVIILDVRGEVLYSQTGFESPSGEDIKNSNLQIPITAQFSFLKILSIHAGPQFNYLASSKLSGESFKEQIDDGSFNFVAGAGVHLGSLEIMGRFIFPSGVKFQFDDAISTASEYKDSNIQLSVGYWF